MFSYFWYPKKFVVSLLFLFLLLKNKGVSLLLSFGYGKKLLEEDTQGRGTKGNEGERRGTKGYERQRRGTKGNNAFFFSFILKKREGIHTSKGDYNCSLSDLNR